MSDTAEAKWRSSGLSDEHAKRLKLAALSAEETAALGSSFQKVEALRIPYFDLEGRLTKFFRARYLGKLPGFAGQAAKPQRYAQPPKTLNEVYYPPLLDVPWSQVAKDPRVGVYVTEGELKAAAGCALGLATLGLGGVDVWRATKRGVVLLPSLAEFDWTGRKVTVVFDSDAATNPAVVGAQLRLAKELTALGAVPAIVTLPATEEGAKQGLDDYLLACGLDAFKALAEEAPLYAEAAALWEMNQEVVYVRDPGMVFVQGTKQRIAPTGFIQHAYANRHYTEVTVDKKGGVTSKKKKLAPRWLEWESRYELAGVTYAPGQPSEYEGKWNTWSGWGCEPVEGDVAPWRWLLDFVFKDKLEERAWFEKWCAYHLQFPMVKPYTSVVVWGAAHGTGKTLIGYSLMRIYGQNAVEVKNKDLHSGFNEWAEGRQFVYGDEITGGDRRVDADYLKGLITQEQVRINAKYVPSYSLPDLIAYFFSTNHPDAIFMEDSDRRYFVHEVVGGPAPREAYEAYDKWLRSKEGPSALFHHLLTLDVTGFNPKAPAPETEAKRAMSYDSKSDLGAWVADLLTAPEALLKPLGPDVAKKCDIFTTAQLLRCYDPESAKRVTANGLGRELKRAGLRQLGVGGVVGTKSGSQRLYAIRNHAEWCEAKSKDAAAHFDKFFAGEGKF
jgi:hypothetical protein